MSLHSITKYVSILIQVVVSLPDTRSYDMYTLTVNPVFSGHSKKDKAMILKTNGSLMKLESNAECSLWSILQYF